MQCKERYYDAESGDSYQCELDEHGPETDHSATIIITWPVEDSQEPLDLPGLNDAPF